MAKATNPRRSLSTTLTILLLWIAFYASFTLVRPALLDDADSVHAEVAREMLLRHHWVTLYANGIRYLEKAPLLYWSMAACMRASQLLGHTAPQALAIAARIPLALTVLLLAFTVEVFARQAFRSARAGLNAALILLSSPGIFLYTRILLPDVMLCLWLTLAMYFFWLTESRDQGTGNREQNRVPRPGSARAGDDQIRVPHPSSARVGDNNARVPHSSQSHCDEWGCTTLRAASYAFAVFCALGVLTKGLIGVVFPIAIVVLYLLLTRGLRGAFSRLRELHPITSTLVFLAVAAPWHILAALANPTQGSPGAVAFSLHASLHWTVPLPTPGNVHGWAWFYFVNEQVLRYLNLRVPRDYGTVPLWLFWGLMLIWLMPWSAFLFHAIASAFRSASTRLSLAPANRHHERSLAQSRQTESKDPNRSQTTHPTTVSLKGTASAVPQTTAAEDAALAAEVTNRSRTNLLLLLWAALPLLFFSLSTRQEYYVLPSLPALALLIANWLSNRAPTKLSAEAHRNAAAKCSGTLAAAGIVVTICCLYLITHAQKSGPNTDLAILLQQNPGDYALSMGHFLDLDTRAMGLFRLPLALTALSFGLLFPAAYILRRVTNLAFIPIILLVKIRGRRFNSGSIRNHVHAANLVTAAGAFTFLLAVHMGYSTFAPVLSSAQLAEAIAPQLAASPNALIVIHQEYEYASTLGFYLQRPSYTDAWVPRPSSARAGSQPNARVPHSSQRDEWDEPAPVNPIHILTDTAYHPQEQVPGSPYGRSSNLYYGSFFPDAPPIFETTATLAAKWHSSQRIFLWQSLDDQPGPLPTALTPVYVIARSGGKEIVSNQPNR